MLGRTFVAAWLAAAGAFVARSGAERGAVRRRASSVETSELPPALATLVNGLASLPDDKYRYKQLLFWAGEKTTLEDSARIPENKVPGCLSTVHIDAKLESDGTVTFAGDSDALVTKGLVHLLVKGLSGSTPEAIVNVDPAFIRTAKIAQSLTPGRNNGFVNMLGVMKAKAAALGAADLGAAGERSVAAEITQRLQALNPTDLDLVDESHLHAGHAGAAGFRGGESHFKLTIVADAFADLARVKRHQLIYTLLADVMPKIHALQITAKTPDELPLPDQP